MRKIVFILLFAAVCLFSPMAAADGGETTSTDMIEHANDLDGRAITYTGEVIGDILNRGDYSWINVSDGSNTIGVWVESVMLKSVDIAGRYDTHGDIVRISGVFHRACAEHGGDMDIHAGKLELIEKGYVVSHPVDPAKTYLAILLTACAMVCIVLVWKRILRKNTVS